MTNPKTQMRTAAARSIPAAAALCAACILVGCGGPYMVTDPASGKAFYTRSVDQNSRAGYVSFKDELSGSKITLQSSEVKEISSKDFDAAVKKPK